MTAKFRILRICFYLLILFSIQCKNSEKLAFSTNREIVIRDNDKMIKADVVSFKKTIKLKADLQYYSYFLDQINMNTGDFEGLLLDGKYTIFNKNNRLIKKGSFKMGLKNGSWKEWRDNGKLLLTEEWKEGKQNGNFIFYDSFENVISCTPYKNGLIHGDAFVLVNSAKVEKKYKNGKEIINNKNNKSRAKSDRNPKPAKKATNDINEQKNTSWIKRFFSFKRDSTVLNDSIKKDKPKAFQKDKNNSKDKDK